jgi:hypothetical protein
MVRSEGGEDASIFNAFRLSPKVKDALPWLTVLFNPELDSSAPTRCTETRAIDPASSSNRFARFGSKSRPRRGNMRMVEQLGDITAGATIETRYGLRRVTPAFLTQFLPPR